MERIPSTPPVIPPLPLGEKRPTWSVMIPVYNCSQFIPAALESVLKQDMGEKYMQIEVIDDASTDADVEELVRIHGRGRVAYYRQPQNVGSIRNFETCINRSKGKLIHLLHGDDRVNEGFYEKMEDIFYYNPGIGAAFCRYSAIDDQGRKLYEGRIVQSREGILADALAKIAKEQIIQVVTMVVKRQVYEHLGSFYAVKYGEDWEMWARIAKHYPIAYTPEILAEYRKYLGSISWNKTEDGQNTKDLAHVLSIIENYLPPEKKSVMAKAKQGCALYCMSKANVIWAETRNKWKAMSQVDLALSLNKSPLIYYHIAKFYIKLTLKIY